MTSISIIIPVYNEENGIESLENAFLPLFQKTNLSMNVLFVNDGSTDKSLDKIKELCLRNNSYSFISFDQNYGLSSAIKAGFDFSRSDWLGYIDADLQTDPKDFLKFESYLNSFDLILGNRINRKDGLVKKLSSRIANSFRDLLLKDGVQDSGCPLKIIRKEFADKIPYFNGSHRFIPALVLMKGGRIKEIPVSHFPRITGSSKFNLWNRLLSPFIDVLAVKWMINRQIFYKILERNNDSKNT